MNCCPSNLLSGLTIPLPPPFPVSKYSLYRQCVPGRGRGCWVMLETIFRSSLTLCIWPDSEPTKLLDHPKQKPRRGGGLRQINTCREVPLQVNIYKWRHFALPSMSLIFLWCRYTAVCHPARYREFNLAYTNFTRQAFSPRGVSRFEDFLFHNCKKQNLAKYRLN